MSFFSKTLKAFAVCATVGLSAASSAQAGSVNISGSGPLGSFTGSLSYTYNAGSAADLIVTLTNTSPSANGGYLTGFAFNIKGNATAVFIDADNATTLNYNESKMNNATAPVAADPFGPYEAGATLNSSNFNGGGAPQNGIPVGVTGIFSFNVTGVDAPSLDVMDFLSERTGNNNDHLSAFVARFRGFEDGGSDKVPVYINDCPPPAIPLPAAASSSLLTMGLLAIGGLGRKALKLARS